MADLDDLLDDLNDRIDDDADTQVTEARKIRYINHGIRAMWPRIYRTLTDSTIEIAADTYEYALPSGFDNAWITRVDIETDDASGLWLPVEDYEILPVLTGRSIIIERPHVNAGARLRVMAAKRLTELVAPTDVYDGPPGTEEIPIWYALGLVMTRRHENRIDYTRYSTVAAANGVDIAEVMSSGQFAFAQFELLLERAAMPMPSRTG